MECFLLLGALTRKCLGVMAHIHLPQILLIPSVVVAGGAVDVPKTRLAFHPTVNPVGWCACGTIKVGVVALP